MSSWPSRRSLTNASWQGIGTCGGDDDDMSAHASRYTHTAAPGPSACNRGVIAGPALLREIDLRGLGRAGCLQLEVRPRALAQQLRRQHLRKAPDVGVVPRHRFIVVLPRHGDAVFGSFELVLQRSEE